MSPWPRPPRLRPFAPVRCRKPLTTWPGTPRGLGVDRPGPPVRLLDREMVLSALSKQVDVTRAAGARPIQLVGFACGSTEPPPPPFTPVTAAPHVVFLQESHALPQRPPYPR